MRKKPDFYEPTEEELDELIRQQRKTMPKAWGRDEGGEMLDLRGRVRAPRVVKLPQTFRRAMHDKNRRTDWC